MINTLLNFLYWNKTKIKKLNVEQLTILIPARNEEKILEDALSQ